MGLTVWSGRYEEADGEWLRWTDAVGTLIPTGKEAAGAEKELAETAERQVAIERQRVDIERQRADQANKKADKLLQLLRKHGIAPDSE